MCGRRTFSTRVGRAMGRGGIKYGIDKSDTFCDIVHILSPFEDIRTFVSVLPTWMDANVVRQDPRSS